MARLIVTLLSKLEIEFEEEDTLYTTFNDTFVYTSLNDDKYIFGMDGKINFTILDADENVIDSWQKDLSSLYYDEDNYVIRTCDVRDGLNGTYTVVVRYFDGEEAATEARGLVTIRPFDPSESGASVNDNITSEDDYVVTFNERPPVDSINVTIDGKDKIIDTSDLIYNEEKNVYGIKLSDLGEELDDGFHSFVVSVERNDGTIELASGNIIVDLKENIDPALTINIANITEGEKASIKITTNDTFSGNVLVKIGNANYTVSVTNGTGSLLVSDLAAGSYNATAIFEKTALFLASTKNTTFTVIPKVKTTISAAAVTTTYATSKNIVITLKDANGNVLARKYVVTITFKGGSKTLKTNDKGQVSYAIGTKVAPNKYDAKIKFEGDSTYAASTATVKVTVKKAKAKIKAKKKTFKAKKKSKKYTVILKTDKGKALKKVKVTITGKFKGKKIKITKKTNSKGKVKFNLKKLTKKGKFKAKVKFAGNKYYNKATKKVTITVKK